MYTYTCILYETVVSSNSADACYETFVMVSLPWLQYFHICTSYNIADEDKKRKELCIRHPERPTSKLGARLRLRSTLAPVLWTIRLRSSEMVRHLPGILWDSFESTIHRGFTPFPNAPWQVSKDLRCIFLCLDRLFGMYSMHWAWDCWIVGSNDILSILRVLGLNPYQNHWKSSHLDGRWETQCHKSHFCGWTCHRLGDGFSLGLTELVNHSHADHAWSGAGAGLPRAFAACLAASCTSAKIWWAGASFMGLSLTYWDIGWYYLSTCKINRSEKSWFHFWTCWIYHGFTMDFPWVPLPNGHILGETAHLFRCVAVRSASWRHQWLELLASAAWMNRPHDQDMNNATTDGLFNDGLMMV